MTKQKANGPQAEAAGNAENGPVELGAEELGEVEGGFYTLTSTKYSLSLSDDGSNQTRDSIVKKLDETQSIGAASDEGL